MKPRLDAIRECFEGAVPAIMATADLAGTPNVAYLSQVQFVDVRHVALSYQFFNRTRQNILANPMATLLVTSPTTAAQYRLSVKYLRTETSGALFESMKAKLAGIAAHSGMTGIFRLLGSDVYEVLDIEEVSSTPLPALPPERNLLSALRLASHRLSACVDLDRLLAETLVCLDHYFDIRHAMLLMLDQASQKLYTVASQGYPESGVGSEIPLGVGVIGIAAREMTPIRIGHMNSEYAYVRAVKENTRLSGWDGGFETEIPMPGLKESRSQMAVPIASCHKPLGILFVESPQDLRFTYDDEDALVALCSELGTAIHLLQIGAGESEETSPQVAAPKLDGGPPLLIRHFAENDSIFLGDDYLIKGVAGSIFWALIQDYVEKKRVLFANRELRLDTRIRLPDVSDNLEARLVLLSRRLQERHAGIRIEKAGRGRFQLAVSRPVQLIQV